MRFNFLKLLEGILL